MTTFVDASALVAVVAGEPERSDLIARIAGAESVLWSAMTCWETVSGLRRSYDMSIEAARIEVDQAAADMQLRLVAIGQAELNIALHAYERFGKGTGHPAKLNMGDCFAYACAKANGARLLYKGDDFARTDLA